MQQAIGCFTAYQHFRQPDSESFVFFLTAERPEDKSIEDVFCLLLEREEYAEASREWNRAAIERCCINEHTGTGNRTWDFFQN